MKILLATAAFLSAFFPFVRAATIIGYDGKEITYGAHRDGLHDRVLHEHQEHRRHDLRHAKLHRLDTSDLPHMLNQEARPMPSSIKLHKHRANQTLDAKTHGVSVTKNLGRNDIRDSATGLSRINKESLYSTDSEKEDLSERVASRLNRIAHAHVRGSKRKLATTKGSAADKFAEAFVKDAPGGLSPAPAPSPGPMSFPGPAPAPMRASGGWGTMDEDMGAPEQGFQGKVVEHDNMVTMTKDWRGEYGPNVEGLSSYVKICALYPDNAWCRERGYHRSTPPPKSSALRPVSAIFVIAALALAVS